MTDRWLCSEEVPPPGGAAMLVGVTLSRRWTQGEGFCRGTGDRINRRETECLLGC